MSDPYSDETHALGIANCSCYLCKHVMNGGELPSKGNNRKKFNKWLEQKGFCFYCLEPIPTWSDGVNEHIIPKSKGGKKTVLSCKECDKIKKNYHTPEEYEKAMNRLGKILDKVKAYAEG